MGRNQTLLKGDSDLTPRALKSNYSILLLILFVKVPRPVVREGKFSRYLDQ